jgi:tetratricopeptide (TPR) repeat protein
MKGSPIGGRSLVICALVLGLAAFATPAAAQTGQVKGKVVDADNKPVDGAIVTIESLDGGSRKFEVKTNGRGDYIQIGLQPGDYNITAKKGDLSQVFKHHIGLDMEEVNFTLKPGTEASGMSEEERKKANERATAVNAAFKEGVTLGGAGKYDEAVAKFEEVAASVPKCVECYTNIGAMYGMKKDYPPAETAYKKAIEIDANSVDAYRGLSDIYNAQKKFNEAAEASAMAMKLEAASGAPGAAGGNAGSVFNQGVILWNAGKIAEAKEQFAQAVKLDPTLADARYWLGMANLNEGKLPEASTEFEEYLKLAPTGQFAEQAKGVLSQIKK